jgi:outer membrane usher protein
VYCLRTLVGWFAGSLLLVMIKTTDTVAAEFDTGFVADFGGANGLKSDLEAMLHEQDIGPGRYLVGINLNRDYFGQRELSFVRKDKGLEACLSQTLLTEMGVKLPPVQDPAIDEQCLDLMRLVDGASVRFDSQQLKIDISVPQLYMSRNAVGHVSPENWDRGINAGFLNYQFSGSQAKNERQSTADYNVYLNGGVNLGDWRLRSSSSYRKDGTWERAATYMQRDLPGTIGNLTLGESVTPGDIFQSIPFRGVQLSSDTQMLPDSLQGYAPVIRGVAQTQARVEVRQHGYSIYSTFVAPGAFEIRDLNAASGSGDLEVVITEADGSVRRFIQPYATLGNLLREGTWRYSVTAGQLHEPYSVTDQPTFTQVSMSYGLPNDFTLSTGGFLGEGYRAYQVGVGKGLGVLGALSLDVTQATTDTRRERVSGQSYGLRYGKAFATGTNFRFAGYRYSTSGYRDFSEAVSQDFSDSYVDDRSSNRRISRRSRLEANISQTLGDSTSLYLNLSQQDYWNSSSQQRQLQFGISGQVQRVNLSLYASKSLSQNDEGLQAGLTLSFPLGRQSASVSLERNSDGSNDQRLGLSGLAGDYNNLDYNVNMLRSERSANTGSASVGYRVPWANVNAGLSSSSAYKMANVGISGSVLAHAGGVELGRSLGETVALVEVKDTPNVGVNNAPGTFTNAKGYSLVPYVQPYRRNRISLDTSKLDAHTDIDSGVSTVTPRRGAVVLVRFKARHTEKVLATVALPSGAVVPFGAAVLDAAGQRVNAVGPMGQVLLSVGDSRDFRLVWGDASDQQCALTLDLEQAYEQEGFKVMNVRCTLTGQ